MLATVQLLTGHSDHVEALAVLKDSSLASVSNDTTIIIWNVTSGTKIKTLTVYTGSVFS